MFDDPVSTVTSVGHLATMLRDLVASGAVLFIGWKARDIVQPMIEFFKKANLFMDETSTVLTGMQGDMKLVMNNHIPHMARDLRKLSGRKPDEMELAHEESLQDPQLER